MTIPNPWRRARERERALDAAIAEMRADQQLIHDAALAIGSLASSLRERTEAESAEVADVVGQALSPVRTIRVPITRKHVW